MNRFCKAGYVPVEQKKSGKVKVQSWKKGTKRLRQKIASRNLDLHKSPVQIDYGVVRDSAYINASDPNTIRPKQNSTVFQQFRMHRKTVSRSMKKESISPRQDYFNQSVYGFGARDKVSNIKKVMRQDSDR